MITLEKLKAELTQDIKIDPTKLAEELLRNSYLYSKCANYLADVRTQLSRADVELKRVTANRLNFYTGRSTSEVCDYVYQTSTELKMVIAADEMVIRAEVKYQIYDNMITLILKAMDAIKGRGFDIKAAMEQRQFEQGK